MWFQLTAMLSGVALGLWLMADDNMDNLRGKRVLVTGASGGIGEQLAYVYAQQGATVVVTARREALINQVASKCRKLSPTNMSHVAIPADMSDVTSVSSLIQKAVAHMGGLDLLVLNHITQSDIATFTGSQRNIDNAFLTMDINYKSYVQMTSLALPYLTESEGGVVVVNSLMGTVPSPKLAGYAASKFALNGFFRSLRSQFVMEQRNVAVTMCVLGFIDTQTAMEGLRKSESTRILKLVSPVSARGTAVSIVGASARRVDVMYHPNNLRGKRVLVTGASGGIGEQLAYVYAQQGATVVVTARREALINQVASKCRKLSPTNMSHVAIPADMSDVTSVSSLIQKAVAHMGGLDLLVLNHITQSDIATFTGSQRNIDNAFLTMDINYKSYVQMTSLALPYLTESEGGVVVVNSLMGTVPSPKLAGYAASKFALNGFFRSLRSQFVMEQRNVAVTMCVLGFIDTQTAMEGLRKSESTRILKLVSPVSARGTAVSIVGASARRVDVMYHPSISNRLFIWLNKLSPSLAEWVLREMARY